MASFKINFATCKGLGEPKEIVSAMEEFGLAEGEPIGVLHATESPAAAFGTLVRRTDLAVQTIDPKTHEVLTETVERATLLPFGAFSKAGRLEVYTGGVSALQDVGEFLAGALGMAVVTDPIELDLQSAVERMMKSVSKFQLRAVRVTDYAASSYMIGPYAPKFMDTDHGLKFMQEYAEVLKTVELRFSGPSARVSTTLRPNGCFNYSCQDDDQPKVQQILRKLITG